MYNIRNFITNYFENNTNIFNLDDDLTKFIALKKEINLKKFKKYESIDFKKGYLDEFIKRGFYECIEKNISIFGIYPVANPYFMRRKIAYGLKYLIGSCWGVINDKNIKVTINDKEDFERTIKFYLKDKNIIRYEFISVISRYYKEKGGMQETRNYDGIYKSCLYLVNKYENICSLNLKKKSGYPEIRLRDKLNKITFKFMKNN